MEIKKLTKNEKAIILLAEYIETIPSCEYKVRKHILETLELEEKKQHGNN